MTERHQASEYSEDPVGVNPGYAAFQLAKALTTGEEHEDPATRKRAMEKVSKWETVLGNILTGAVEYGSRTPVGGVPSWATLEVVTGGFATGGLLAAGPLLEHEKQLLAGISGVQKGEERRALNAHFLTETGLSELRDLLQTGRFDVTVPEEGALMVAAWLADNGRAEEARSLLDTLSPYFGRLRFYPIPLERPRQSGSRVHIQTVGATIDALRAVKPNGRVLAQKEAVGIWLPLYDRIVALFLETVENDWPCQSYPEGWRERAIALLDEYTALRKEYTHCGKMERGKEHSAQLREFLGRCARNPDGLTGRDVGRIRLILKRYMDKRGAPGSPTCAEARRRQAEDVNTPLFSAISRIVAMRLEKYPANGGVDNVNHLKEAIAAEEAPNSGMPEGCTIPPTIQRKAERCLNESVDVLVERGLITSGETLARILPQVTSGIRAAGISDPTLRRLYSAIYSAFRRRRSLLLLNLEKQVQMEELPWVAAIDRSRSNSLSSPDLAKETLQEITALVLTSFPYAIVPNKLLQELRALVKSANLVIPLVDELAADIFMGEFSAKYVDSARRAADLLDGTLYATYYAIDCNQLRQIPKPAETRKRGLPWKRTAVDYGEFARFCAARAGVTLGTWDPATNGMVIEQQQILTTQNLAALFAGLDLTDTMKPHLDEMAKTCFRWICRRHQMKVDEWHARLIMLKNTAYAWRQMVFFLSLLPECNVGDFLSWAKGDLNKQSEQCRNRLAPALKGLALATEGLSPGSDSAGRCSAPRFLGWSKAKHWMLDDRENVVRSH